MHGPSESSGKVRELLENSVPDRWGLARPTPYTNLSVLGRLFSVEPLSAGCLDRNLARDSILIAQEGTDKAWQ
jgi:hypothetical protein